ncbi:MAG: hypothetical protein MMC23_002274 [Stictis urceolatum]|nr:hypothetical protein [Stictis urceolata]
MKKIRLLLLVINILTSYASPLFQGLQAAIVTDAAQTNRTISSKLFFELEELSRLVAISYCVGYQGIYKPFECLSHCADFERFELVKTWNSGIIDSASCGYVALSHPPHPPRIIVAFRGSNSLSDTISDLMTLPAEYTPYDPPVRNETSFEEDHTAAKKSGGKCENCKAHSGFLSAWQTTKDTLFPVLRDTVWKYPGYELVLTGHSLGGAVAGLAALECEAMGWKPIVTTFGEPRFGNEELAHFIDETFPIKEDHDGSPAANPIDGQGGDRISRYRRVTHAGDPVPLYPPDQWGWKPHSGEVFISKSDLPPAREDLVLCNGPSDPKCVYGSEDTAFVLKKQGIRGLPGFPAQWKFWEILFAHREYFWRIGLCWDPQSGGYLKAPDQGSNDEL